MTIEKYAALANGIGMKTYTMDGYAFARIAIIGLIGQSTATNVMSGRVEHEQTTDESH